MNQHLPNKQDRSNNMTVKSLPFSYRSRSNSRDHRDNSRHRSPNKFPHSNSKLYYGKVFLNHRVEMVCHTLDPPTLKTNLLITQIAYIQIILDINHLTIIEMEIVQDAHSHTIDFAMYETTITHS